MSGTDAQFRALFEKTFTRLVETEKRLAAKTEQLENVQTALATVQTKIEGFLGPVENPQLVHYVCTTQYMFDDVASIH